MNDKPIIPQASQPKQAIPLGNQQFWTTDQTQKKSKVTLISFNLKSGHAKDLVVCRKSNGDEIILYRHEIPIFIESYNLWLKYRRQIPQLSTQEFFTISFHEIDGGEL